MAKNPGLNKSFLADTPSDGGERRPNRAIASRGGPIAPELGGTRTPLDANQSPDAPEGVMNATTAQSRRRSFDPGDLPHTPSMDGPASTRPMRKTHKPLSAAEAPQSSD